MELLWFSGFEANDTGVFTTTSGTVTLVTTTVKTGTYAVCLENDAYVDVDLDVYADDIYISIQVEPEDVYEGGGASRFFDIIAILGDSKELKVRMTSDQNWDAYVDGDKVADGAIAATDGWQNLQIYIKAHDTYGTIQTKVDGVIDVIYTGDTKPGTSSTIETVRIHSDADQASKYSYFDDLFICKGQWPGQIIIGRYNPSAISANQSANWLNTGNGQLADLIDGSDATFMSTTENDSDLLMEIENTSSTDGKSVVGVKVNARIKGTADDDFRWIESFDNTGSYVEAPDRIARSVKVPVTADFAWYAQYYDHPTIDENMPFSWDLFQYCDYGIESETLTGVMQVSEFFVELARRSTYAVDDPYSGDNWRFTQEGYVETCWIHSGLIDVTKYFSAIKAFADNVNGEYYRIMVDYKLDTDKDWTTLADNPNDDGVMVKSEQADEVSLYHNGYATGKRIKFRLRFSTEYQSITPHMYAYVLETFPKIPRRRTFAATVRVQANRQNVIGGVTYESFTTYYDALVALVSTAEPVTLRSTNPAVDGALVEVVGVDDERMFLDPDNPDQSYAVMTLSMVEVD